MWTVILLAAAAVFATAFTTVRCRRAGRLIDRILVEELGPERLVEPAPGNDRSRRATR